MVVQTFYRLGARGLAVAGGGWVGETACLRMKNNEGSKLDEPRVRRVLNGRLELGVGG